MEALLRIISWTDFIFIFVSRVRPTAFAKKNNMVCYFAEKRCHKSDAKLQKLTFKFCGTKGFSDCYRNAVHVLSPSSWERIRANRRSGLKRKLLSPTRKFKTLCGTLRSGANYHSERSRGGKI